MAEYINREAFEEDVRLRYCKDCHKLQHEIYCRFCLIDDMLGEVEDAPAADVVEVRHGRWLPQKLCGENIFDCSECKTIGSPQWKWCPVCGAKMDGKGEESV